MGNVVVVGSINVDFIIRVPTLPGPGETVTGGSFQQAGGGKGANQAAAAARVGTSVTLIAAVGDDELGRDALAEMAGAGVDVGHCLRLPDARTGAAMIMVDGLGENQIAVASGANELLDETAVERALSGVEARGGGVEGPRVGVEALAGDVLLAGFEVPAAAVVAAARWAAGRGMRVIVNPAPARPLSDELAVLHPILTPNLREAAKLSGVSDPERAATALHRRTEAAVIVTLGRDGALMVDGPTQAPRVTAHPALPVEVVDSTGAGDVLNGILAAELARGTELVDAVRLAVAGASLSTRVVGARAGLPTRDEIERQLHAVRQGRLRKV